MGPFVTKAAEDFKADGGVDVTVGISGTGGGFERFCAGETDLSNASRAIDEEEIALCEDGGVEYIEFRVATDALTNVVNTGERLGDLPDGRPAERDLGAGLEGDELEPGRSRPSPTSRCASTARGRTPARSTTSPT